MQHCSKISFFDVVLYNRDPCNFYFSWYLLITQLQCFLTSFRFSGSLLLEEIVTAFEDYGINSILEASKMRFHESQELKQAGSADWWRVSFQFIYLNSALQFLAYHVLL